MICRDFENLWSTRPAAELPPAAHVHLSACPVCAAMVQADRATDAALRQARAARPPADADRAWIAIERALAERSACGARLDWRRPLALVAAGLAAAAVAAFLLGRPTQHTASPGPPMVQSPGSPSPDVPTKPASSNSPHAQPTKVGFVSTDRGFNPGHLAVRPARSGGAAPMGQIAWQRPAPVAGQVGPAARGDGIGAAPEDALGPDLLRLNGGRLGDARPFSPALAPLPLPPPLPLVEARKPGSLVLDDLLSLNPIRVAALGDAGFSAAAQTLAAEAPTTDARLQQKVFVHATMEKLSDLLAGLSKATGVTLVPRMEVAAERVSLWADDRTLMDVMRDLRHLHGYFWSRSKQGDKYVYSLWQDAQSRAREDAETQRLGMEQHRQFEESVWKHVRALHASDEELRKMGRDDPYLIAQMLHPVVKNAWRLFAALSPDQQVLLTKGQTPNDGSAWGMLLEIFPPPDDPYPPHPWSVHGGTPKGDIVTLTWQEMTPEQRHAVEGILTGAADWTHRPGRGMPNRDALQGADPKMAAVSLFRSGDPGIAEGLSLRLDFENGGKPYGLYSGFAVPPFSDRFYNDLLRKGEFRLWQGAQEEVSQALGGNLGTDTTSAAPKPASAAGDPPDPVLDAPLSFTWTLPLREDAYKLSSDELVAALHQEIGRPLIADGRAPWVEQKRSVGPLFRWEKRPLRELLQRFFPGWGFEAYEGAIFAKNPDRLRDRARQIPPAVEEFLDQRTGTLTMDDMAFFARSLSPWEVTRLQQHLPFEAMDQVLAAQELLKLYGELAAAQRSVLPHGLAFSALTPPQQRLFLQFAQRQRPYVEPWRFQSGGLRLTPQPPPPRNPHDEHAISPVSRMLFHVQFQDGDAQPFPVDLYSAQDQRWNRPLSIMVGKPFPFPTRHAWSRGAYDDGPTVWEPGLADPRLRDRAMVILVAWPFAEPYAGTRSAPPAAAWARALAARLQNSGVTVVHVAMTQKGATPEPAASWPGNLIRVSEPGDEGGLPFGPKPEGNYIFHWPSVVVVGGDEIVRAVFDGQDAWDTAAVERAARSLAPAPTNPRVSTRP